MASHGRQANRVKFIFRKKLWCLVFGGVLGWVSTGNGQIADWPVPLSWHGDAELTDLFFIDADNGWVVGERGTVLYTNDGGERWHSKNLAIDCRLESVFFVDSMTGWICGGFRFPGASSSQAVLFRTEDGGRTWRRLQGVSIPKLNKLQFQDAMQGWAVGESSAIHPSGIYTTGDGGKTWSAHLAGQRQHWQTGDRQGNQFIVASQFDQIALCENGKFSAGYFPDSDPVRICEMHLNDQQNGLAVGDRGAVLTTKNGGLSWHRLNHIDADFVRRFDLRTLFVQNRSFWFAGSPGTYVFKFDQETGRLHKRRTPLRVGINRLFFVTDQIGWAIGAASQIIQTVDGGETWTVQRNGYDRLGILQIIRHPSQIGSEVFAKYCGDRNFLGGAVIVGSATTFEPERFEHARQASTRVGASIVQHYATNASNQLRSDALTREIIAKQIRILRPSVIVVPRQVQTATADDLQTTILSAVNDAAAASSGGDSLSAIGLSPWQVDRVVVHDRKGAGEFKIASGEFLPSLSCLVGDLVVPSRMMLGQNIFDRRAVCLTTIFTNPNAANSPELVSSNYGAVRSGSIPAAGNLTAMRSLAGKSKSMNRLRDTAGSVTGDSGRWMTVVVETVSQLEQVTAGVWLFELADQLHRQGQSEHAARVHSYLARNLRGHPLCVASLRWLFHYYASDEMQLLNRQWHAKTERPVESAHTQKPPQTRPVSTVENGVVTTIWKAAEPDDESNPSPSDPRQSNFNQADLRIEANLDLMLRRRYQQAGAISQSLSLIDFAAPQTGQLLYSKTLLNNKIDPNVSIEQQLEKIVTRRANPEVAEIAKRELILREFARGQVKHRLVCATAKTKPQLDAMFSESHWRHDADSVSGIDLTHSSTGDDLIMFASDDEFFYIALQIEKRGSVRYETPVAVRKRDSNLALSDRVEISIDIDRDASICFLFSVDASGQLAESCGGNLAWDPTWYVASRQDQDRWFAEIAIPLSQLRLKPTGQIWAIRLDHYLDDQLVGKWPPHGGGQPAENSSSYNRTASRDLYRMPIRPQIHGTIEIPGEIPGTSTETNTNDSSAPNSDRKKQ